ncbi:MAG: hypothetical protein P9L99_14190 [Candidatus Lernaella stagnicola]|nr:hypothetical protein [Candidatus Lernaella stagnicola]
MSDGIVLATPGDLTRGGVLEIGVEFAGAQQREFIVGPLTVDVVGMADATMPDWIDYDLITRVWVQGLDDKARAKQGIKGTDWPELTRGDARRGEAMAAARYNHQVKFRITRLGGIPRPNIPDAVGKLLPSDFSIITTLAEEVDAAEQTFREENAIDLGRGPGRGPGGDPAGPHDTLDL